MGQIADFTAMSAADRDAKIKEDEASMEKLEKDFTAFVEGLNKQYKEESEKKEKGVADIKNSGLGLLKAVQKHVRRARVSSKELFAPQNGPSQRRAEYL